VAADARNTGFRGWGGARWASAPWDAGAIRGPLWGVASVGLATGLRGALAHLEIEVGAAGVVFVVGVSTRGSDSRVGTTVFPRRRLAAAHAAMGRIAATSTRQATVRSRDPGLAHDLDIAPLGRLGGVSRGPRRVQWRAARRQALRGGPRVASWSRQALAPMHPPPPQRISRAVTADPRTFTVSSTTRPRNSTDQR